LHENVTKELMPAVTTFNVGKAVMGIPAVEKQVNDLFNVRTPEAELFCKAIVVNPDEFLKIVFDTTIPARRFRIAWSIDGWSAVHFSEESPSGNYSQRSLPEISRKIYKLSRSSPEALDRGPFCGRESVDMPTSQ
jgi:hypothetical protein